MPGLRFTLSPLLDAVQMMSPEALVLRDPVMHGLQLLRLEAIQTQRTLLGDRHKAHFPQHTQVLRDGGLGEPERVDHIADRVRLPVNQQFNELAPARFGDRIEYVGGRGSTWHYAQYIPIWEYVKPFLTAAAMPCPGRVAPVFSSPLLDTRPTTILFIIVVNCIENRHVFEAKVPEVKQKHIERRD